MLVLRGHLRDVISVEFITDERSGRKSVPTTFALHLSAESLDTDGRDEATNICFLALGGTCNI